LKENIERVRRGLDPLGVVRDPGHGVIDTNLTESIKQMARLRAADEIFRSNV
jgi:hypothetical protein